MNDAFKFRLLLTLGLRPQAYQLELRLAAPTRSVFAQSGEMNQCDAVLQFASVSLICSASAISVVAAIKLP